MKFIKTYKALLESLQPKFELPKPVPNDSVKCPICDEGYVSKCRCKIGDMTCANGHHFGKYNGKIVEFEVPKDNSHPIPKI